MIKYNNITEIDWMSKKEVEEKKKTDLKKYEFLGIEEVINQIIQDFEWNNFGQAQTNIKNNNFFRTNHVKLEEGFKFDDKILSSAFVLTDGIVVGVFECFNSNKELEEGEEEGEFKYYRLD